MRQPLEIPQRSKPFTTRPIPTVLLSLLFGLAGLCFSTVALPQPAAGAQGAKTSLIWLSDLQERNVLVGDGQFGNNGSGGFPKSIISTRGRTSHHGLAMYPDAHVEYLLDKKYRTFRASATMNYTAVPDCNIPIIFRVLADGKLLWESRGMRGESDCQPCLLDITNTTTLRLETLFRPGATGDRARAFAVWIDPLVTIEPPPKANINLFDSSQFSREEKAKDFRAHVKDLLQKEDFDALEKIAQLYRDKDEECTGASMLSLFYGVAEKVLSDETVNWDEHVAYVERWKKAKPDSITPLIAAANAYTAYAWQARGKGVANRVTEDKWKTFHDRLEKGHAYLDEATAKPISDGATYVTLIRYALNEDLPRDKVFDVFKHGKDFPRRYYHIYNELANYLLPKWHGAPGELESMAASLQKLLGGELGDEVYFRMACIGFPDFGEKFFEQSNFKYADLKPGLLVTIRDNCECDHFVNFGCCMACLAGDKETASLLFRRLDKSTLNSNIWGSNGRMEYWRRKYDPYIEPPEESKTLFDPLRNPVLAVAFVGNDHLLSTSKAPLIFDWDLSRDKVGRIIKGGSYGVRDLFVDHDGHTAVLCYMPKSKPQDVQAFLQPLGGGKPQELQGHTSGIARVYISDDGAVCATTSYDKTVRLRKVDDLEHSVVLNHPEATFDVAISPDGKQAATTTARGGVWLWNAKTGEADGKPLKTPGDSVNPCYIHYMPSGKELILVSRSGVIEFVDLANHKTFETHKGDELVQCFAFSGDGNWAALGHVGGRIDIFSTSPPAFVHSYFGHSGRCHAVAFSPDSTMLASGSYDGDIKIWPISKLKPPAAVK